MYHPFAALRERMKRRSALLDLAHLDPRLLRDMGIEPGDVYDAMSGRRRSVLFNPMRKPDRG